MTLDRCPIYYITWPLAIHIISLFILIASWKPGQHCSSRFPRNTGDRTLSLCDISRFSVYSLGFLGLSCPTVYTIQTSFGLLVQANVQYALGMLKLSVFLGLNSVLALDVKHCS